MTPGRSRGWTEEDKSALRDQGKLPYHRQIAAYGSLLDARDWICRAADPRAVWEYMAENPEIFIEYKYFISLPVQAIAEEVANAEPDQLVSLSLKLGDLPGEYENPDSQFHLYSKASAFRQALTKIATALSSVLMKMLEDVLGE